MVDLLGLIWREKIRQSEVVLMLEARMSTANKNLVRKTRANQVYIRLSTTWVSSLEKYSPDEIDMMSFWRIFYSTQHWKSETEAYS